MSEQLLITEKIKLACGATIEKWTLNRPKVLNALSPELVAELDKQCKRLLSEIAADINSVRGLYLTGSGEKAFVAGADIASMLEYSSAQAGSYSKKTQDCFFNFEKLPIPVVAAVNGYALGGGCELALSCDMIFASENAVFGLPESLLGLLPGFGGTVRMTTRVGMGNALDLMYSGRKVKSSEAQKMGIVQRMFSSVEELNLEVQKYFDSFLAKTTPVSIAAIKRLAVANNKDLTVAGNNRENEVFAENFNTKDSKEGIKAFLEKRKANFIGA